MKSDPTAASVAAILSEILADLAFMFPDQNEPIGATGGEWIETSIGYEGPVGGQLRFRCTRTFSVILASNLLGLDRNDGDVERKAEDAVKELMNVVCGHVVTTLHGTDAVFNLSIPEVTPLGPAYDWEHEANEADSTLHIEGFTVQLFHTAHAVAEARS